MCEWHVHVSVRVGRCACECMRVQECMHASVRTRTSISRSIASASALCFMKKGVIWPRMRGNSSSASLISSAIGASPPPALASAAASTAASAAASRALYSVPISPERWRTYSWPQEPRSSREPSSL